MGWENPAKGTGPFAKTSANGMSRGKFNRILTRRHNTRLQDCVRSGQLREIPRDPRRFLGCTYADWAEHLGLTESDELTPEWEIDHTIAVKYYDLNNEEDLYRCFNYKNTQLLHVNENRAKSSALPDLETLLALSAIWPVAVTRRFMSWYPELVERYSIPLSLGEHALDECQNLVV